MIPAVNSESGRKALAMRTDEISLLFFTFRAMIFMVFYDVFFTIIAKWRTDKITPLTGMGSEEV